MGDLRTEPSMEEILASIKRIIADDGLALGTRTRPRADVTEGSAAATPPPVAPSPPPPATEPVLELTDQVAPATAPAPAAAPAAAHPAPPPNEAAAPAALVSEDAACASRHSLSALSSMVLRTPGADNTLDGLVRDLLRPMLKEWLDARLPDLVETLVAREIARITGKAL